MQSQNITKQAESTFQICPRLSDFNVCGSLDGESSHHMCSSSTESSSITGFFQGQSFENQLCSQAQSRSLLDLNLAATADCKTVLENANMATHNTALTWKRCMSLPISVGSKLATSTSSTTGEIGFSDHDTSQKQLNPAKVSRSFSVPLQKVIMRSITFPALEEPIHAVICPGVSPAHLREFDEESPVEEAVCRVCLDGLCSRRSLKLECSCRGALSLMHEECAVKWFSIKGNKKCDVCREEIRNLRVTSSQMQTSAQGSDRLMPNSQFTRPWQEMVILILVNMTSYFFFLEQLLASELKFQAIAVAAPYSFSLGLSGSIFAILLACREYAWAYSAFQFALVATFLHLFYAKLRARAVYAILYAALSGFGVAFGINSIFLLIFAGRNVTVRTQANSGMV